MGNDRAFAAYAAIVIGGGLLVVSSLVVAGIAQIPAPLSFVEHVGIALFVRAAYKSLDGSRWSVFDLWADIRDRVQGAHVPASGTADATS